MIPIKFFCKSMNRQKLSALKLIVKYENDSLFEVSAYFKEGRSCPSSPYGYGRASTLTTQAYKN